MKRKHKSVLTREKPHLGVPAKLPYYKDTQPEYKSASSPEKQSSAPAFIGFIVGFVIVLGIVYFVFLGDSIGAQRNCIKSVMSSEPSCEPDDGVVRKTYLNGRYVGKCAYIDNVGNCY